MIENEYFSDFFWMRLFDACSIWGLQKCCPCNPRIPATRNTVHRNKL